MTHSKEYHTILEFREIAEQIESAGGTAVTIGVLEDYRSHAKESGVKEVKMLRREGNAAQKFC